jgi:hypothetical protein
MTKAAECDEKKESSMNATLFSLVNSEDCREVYAWGMELWYDEPETEKERRVATVFIPGVHDGKDLHSVHPSAENARDTHNRILPINLEVEWPALLGAE